ncbi:hypothetical protein H310_01565 [Aphanomyces invadans]|uniref:Transmembrane protein 198 n=1 Tax=Aphanomyces invadans TaxID=157072 RepID=A0A024UT31_9STRA|nr:hypothetical protein H310_01565 [Aphanomyces invadans]ETW09115.1 hypothetical protein H310_01565 [Aphanomyces invadans]|eukprot:XP_008862920.1 hypothetical protein H310_01565 [Aphanomyces invadans]
MAASPYFAKHVAMALMCVAFVVAQTASTTIPPSKVDEVLNKTGDQLIDELAGGDSATARWLKNIIAAVAILATLAVTFAGYKLIYPVLFIASFFLGAVFSYDVLLQAFANESPALVGFFIGGLIAAILVVYFYDVGIFAVGAVAGGAAAFLLVTSVFASVGGANHVYYHYGFLVVGSLLGGLAAIYLEKPALVIATAFGGATIFVGALGHFIGGYPTVQQLTDVRATSSFIGAVPSSWWGYLAGTVALFLLGAYVQFNHTARNVDHIRGDTVETKPLRSAYQTI